MFGTSSWFRAPSPNWVATGNAKKLGAGVAAALFSAFPLAGQTGTPSTAGEQQVAQAQPPAQIPCSHPEHSQFDYWVGYWDVYRTGTNTLVAHSLVERRYNGCAIRENWMPLGWGGGGSFSVWHAESRRWRQLWVDSRNGWVEFSGGIVDGAMELTGFWARSGPNGENGTVRMRYERGENGSVRQRGQFSADGGRTWTPSFDLTYRRSAGQPPVSAGN